MKNMYFVHNDKHFWTDKSMYISLTITLRKSYHNHKPILNFVSGERIHYQIQHGCPMAGPSLVCIRIWLCSSRHLLDRTRDVQKRLSYMLLFTYCKASFASFAYAKWVVDYCLSLALHIFFSNKLFLFVVNNKSLFIYIFFNECPRRVRQICRVRFSSLRPFSLTCRGDPEGGGPSRIADAQTGYSPPLYGSEHHGGRSVWRAPHVQFVCPSMCPRW